MDFINILEVVDYYGFITHRLHVNQPLPDHEHGVPVLLALLYVLVGVHAALRQLHSGHGHGRVVLSLVRLKH